MQDDAAAATTSAIRTPDQRVRVFISSTMKELAEERAAVREAVHRLRMSPVIFETGARPHPPRELYKAYLEQSDVFIGIYAQEYGWVAPGMERSGLEDEFLLSEGKPRLIYIKAGAERAPRLAAMLRRIAEEGGLSYKYFHDAQELADLVQEDLALLLTERFQAASPAAPSARPPGCALPVPGTRLIGRQRELAAIEALIHRPEVRIVTLTGPGGTGKTRLAVEIARRLCPVFNDEVYFVSLASVREPSLVTSAIAGGLGIYEGSTRPLLEILRDDLRRRRALLVLDNLEQIVEAAGQLAYLVETAPGLKLLVTSREALQLRDEHEFPVAPLPTPTAGETGEALPQYPAVELFLERARAVRPEMPVNEELLRSVADICGRLDGLPLAIELAAANVRYFSPQQILERLGNRLDLLNRGARDLPERQRTMRAAIAWSYDLLDETEKALFARLSVFAGSFSAGAAASIANPGGELGVDTLDGLAALAAKSLLQPGEWESGEPRFQMLELVRAFAAEQLAARGETSLMRDRHCRHFSEFAAEHEEVYLSTGAEAMLKHFNADYPNRREALSWGVERIAADVEPPGPVDAMLRFLSFYWYLAGRLSEGRELSRQAVRFCRGRRDRYEASALVAEGAMAMWQSDLPAANRLLEESVALWREIGDEAPLSFSLITLGVALVNQGKTARAREVLEESLELVKLRGESPLIGVGLMHLGNVALDAQDWEAARAYFEQGLENQKRAGSAWGIASLLNNLGEVARCTGDYQTASRYYTEAFTIFQELEAAGDVARGRHSLGYVALRSGDLEWARGLFCDALEDFRRLGNRRGVAESLQGLAGVAAGRAQFQKAALLLGASERALEEIEARLWPSDRIERSRDLAVIEAGLGCEATAAAIADGRLLTIEDAIEHAERTFGSGGVC